MILKEKNIKQTYKITLRSYILIEPIVILTFSATKLIKI